MLNILRDALLGQIIRYVSGNRVLLYPEEKLDFELPKSYTTTNTTDLSTKASGSVTPRPDDEGLENQRVPTGPHMTEKIPSSPIIPAHLKDGTILVDWYTTDDPENPQSWSSSKKAFVGFQIWYPEHFLL
jgi:MFS transporter, DHA1 family, multidrug resistance protein